jgi:hypothetical protein
MKSLSELRNESNHRYKVWESSGYVGAIAIKRHQMFTDTVDWLVYLMFHNKTISTIPKLIKT